MGWALRAMAEHLEAVTAGRINRLLLNVPPGTMKPMDIESQILTDTGYVKLAEIQVGDRVLTHRGRFRPVLAVHEQGQLPTLRISTFNGRTVRAAPDHPFLTTRGWIPAGDLRVGDYCGRPHRTEDFSSSPMDPKEARVLGYLVGDGSLTTRSPHLTSMTREIIDDFIECVKSIGFWAYEAPHPTKGMRANKIVMKSTEGRWAPKSEPPVITWLKKHGLYRSNSYTKRVPMAVMNGGAEAMANFLGAYWSTDGTLGVRHSGNKTTLIASATTVGQDLATDIQQLGAALNIDLRVRKHVNTKLKTARQGDQYVSYNIITSRRNEVVKIGALPGLIKEKREKGLNAFRDRFDPHFYEDEITEIVPGGEAQCRCLTVEEDSSFTANNLTVHNSMIVSVFWPAWEWGPKALAHMRVMSASHELTLALRDNRRTKLLVESDWYQARWPLPLAEDQHAKTRFENSKGGFRLARPITSLTGERAHRVLIDDPHKVDQAESEKIRSATVLSFRESATSRLVNPERSAIVVIMQRVHEGDVSGEIISHPEWGYTHLRLPMRFEVDHRCETDIGFVDPRSAEGELLFPERFPIEVVDRDELTLGPYATAAQHQQRPVPRTGAMFKTERLEIVDTLPEQPTHVWRGWDKAGTDGGEGARSAGVLIGYLPRAKKFAVLDSVTGRWSAGRREDTILQTANLDGKKVRIVHEQEPGSGGLESAQATTANLAGYRVTTERPVGNKEARADPFAVQVESRNVLVLKRPWTRDFVEELRMFPRGKLKDQVDAGAMAFNHVAKASRTHKLKVF